MDPMDSSSDESSSDKNAGHVRLIVGVLCPLVLVLFVVVGVVCYRYFIVVLPYILTYKFLIINMVHINSITL